MQNTDPNNHSFYRRPAERLAMLLGSVVAAGICAELGSIAISQFHNGGIKGVALGVCAGAAASFSGTFATENFAKSLFPKFYYS